MNFIRISLHGILACLPQNRKTLQPSSGGQFRPIDDDDRVSTGSSNDRVSPQATVEIAKALTRSLPLPVLISSPINYPTLPNDQTSDTVPRAASCPQAARM